jgi:hypothetical protein
MHQNDGRRMIAGNHAADLLRDEQGVQKKLGQLRTLSRIAVILGIVAPILAGSTVAAAWLNDRTYWPLATGILTLVASAGVALHKGLDCMRNAAALWRNSAPWPRAMTAFSHALKSSIATISTP